MLVCHKAAVLCWSSFTHRSMQNSPSRPLRTAIMINTSLVHTSLFMWLLFLLIWLQYLKINGFMFALTELNSLYLHIMYQQHYIWTIPDFCNKVSLEVLTRSYQSGCMAWLCVNRPRKWMTFIYLFIYLFKYWLFHL